MIPIMKNISVTISPPLLSIMKKAFLHKNAVYISFTIIYQSAYATVSTIKAMFIMRKILRNKIQHLLLGRI
jgi:hypothetical protein